MADETPLVVVVVDENGNPVTVDNEQTLEPVQPIVVLPPPSEQIIVVENYADSGGTIVVPPTTSEDIIIKPVSTNIGTIDVSQPVAILPSTVDEVVVKPVSGETEPLDHLSTLRAGFTDLVRYRAVIQRPDGTVEYLDPTDQTARRAFLGIVMNPAVAGRKTTICIHGIISNANWNWQPGPVYSETDGVLTQEMNQNTFQIGQAITPTMLLVGTLGTTDSAPGVAQTFVWTAPSASTTWSITHNLERYPSVTLVDSAHSVMLADVTYDDINTITVTFAYATAGSAYLV